MKYPYTIVAFLKAKRFPFSENVFRKRIRVSAFRVNEVAEKELSDLARNFSILEYRIEKGWLSQEEAYVLTRGYSLR